MEWMLMVAVFWLGASLASFVNVAAHRILRGENFARGRSRCPACKTDLQARDLIPLVSYLWLGGRCRYCRESVSVRYPLVEVLLGAYAVLLFGSLARGILPHPFFFWGLELGTLAFPFFFFLYLALGALLLFTVLTDLEAQTIFVGPVRIGILTGAALLVSQLFFAPGAEFGLMQNFGSAAALFVFFFSLWFFTKGRGFGLGDAELAALLSLYLVFPRGVLAALFAFWIGALAGLWLMAARGYSLKSRIPFGPFLALGFLGALFIPSFLVAYFAPIF